MTSKEDWKDQWQNKEPIERRARLNELAVQGYDSLDDDGKREHDQLATMIAEDEDVAAQKFYDEAAREVREDVKPGDDV